MQGVLVGPRGAECAASRVTEQVGAAGHEVTVDNFHHIFCGRRGVELQLGLINQFIITLKDVRNLILVHLQKERKKS